MKISIIGTGYVGLVTGVCLADKGNSVICVDIDKNKINMINKGKIPIYELNLDRLLKKVLSKKTFFATTNLEKSIYNSDITIISVGTPDNNGKIDLSYIKEVSKQIGLILKNKSNYHIVAVKSTVLPMTTELVVKPILEKYSTKKVGEFGLCMNPEFLREGSAIEDAMNPDRIIIGQYDNKSGREFVKIYSKFNCPKIFTNLRTAELIKYVTNSLLATLISYSNEIARISEGIGGIDIVDVWKGLHLDSRLSPFKSKFTGKGNARIKPGILSYIWSGCGYGGSCFPKDTKALVKLAYDIGVKPEILNSVINVNKTQPEELVLYLKNIIGNLKNKKIAVLGLAFKPDTNDTRESPAIAIIKSLLKSGAIVTCHDPVVHKKDIKMILKYPKITFASSIEEAIIKADAAIVVTAWEEYRKLSPEYFKQKMKTPIVIDGRRIYSKEEFLKENVCYKGIGYR